MYILFYFDVTCVQLAVVNDNSIDETASLPSSLARLGGITGQRPKSVPAHVNRNKDDVSLTKEKTDVKWKMLCLSCKKKHFVYFKCCE